MSKHRQPPFDTRLTPETFTNYERETRESAQELATNMLDGIAAVLDPEIATENLDPREQLFRLPGGDPEVIRQAVLIVAADLLIASFANKPIDRGRSWDKSFNKAIGDLEVLVGFDPDAVQEGTEQT